MLSRDCQFSRIAVAQWGLRHHCARECVKCNLHQTLVHCAFMRRSSCISPFFSLIGSVARMVHNNVASKDPDICYAAKLLGMQGERFSKPKKVFCFISPKQLTIKEYLLKFIPKRLVTFRLCPSTKVRVSANCEK